MAEKSSARWPALLVIAALLPLQAIGQYWEQADQVFEESSLAPALTWQEQIDNAAHDPGLDENARIDQAPSLKKQTRDRINFILDEWRRAVPPKPPATPAATATPAANPAQTPKQQ